MQSHGSDRSILRFLGMYLSRYSKDQIYDGYIYASYTY